MPDIRNISDVENTEKGETREKTETEKKHPKSIKTIFKTIKNRALLIFYGLLIVSVIVVAVLFSVYTFFKIDKVNIEGSTLYTEEEILSAAGIKKGDSLVFADTKGAEINIERKLLYVEDVSLNKSIPSSLNIKVTQAVPTYSVEFKGKYIYISAKGKILEISSSAMAGAMVINGGEITEKDGYLSFADEKVSETFESLINAISETGTAGIGYIDISNVFDIKAEYDHRVILEFGTMQDLDYKMKFAVNIINNENGIGQDERGVLDLSLARDTNKSYFTPEIYAGNGESGEGTVTEFTPKEEITSRGEDIPDV